MIKYLLIVLLVLGGINIALFVIHRLQKKGILKWKLKNGKDKNGVDS